MTNNQNYLKKVQALIKKFDEEKDTEHLGNACIELQKVNLKRETNLSVLAQVRLAALIQWLSLLQAIDANIQPGFDISKGVSIKVPMRKGVTTEDRRKAVEANDIEIDNFNLQVQLGRLNNRITPLAKTYVHRNYTGLPNDQLELKTTIEKTLKNVARKEDFLKLLVPVIKK